VSAATQAMLGTIGIWLLVAGAVAIVAETALMGYWGIAVGRRTRVLSERIENERALLEADVERLRRAIAETRALWQPYRRLLRWLRHPLVLALLASYRRRLMAR
jgi:hypothetical protein